jgi:hypothetical protein
MENIKSSHSHFYVLGVKMLNFGLAEIIMISISIGIIAWILYWVRKAVGILVGRND